jgi:hypothetical protein
MNAVQGDEKVKLYPEDLAIVEEWQEQKLPPDYQKDYEKMRVFFSLAY